MTKYKFELYKIISPEISLLKEEFKRQEVEFAKICKISRGKLEVTSESKEFIEKYVWKAGHTAMLEWFRLRVIVSVSRKTAVQLHRYRTGTTYESSSRHVRFNSIVLSKEEMPENDSICDIPDFSMLGGKGMFYGEKTIQVYENNMRNWNNIFFQRLDKTAETEIRELCIDIRDLIFDSGYEYLLHPYLRFRSKGIVWPGLLSSKEARVLVNL